MDKSTWILLSGLNEGGSGTLENPIPLNPSINRAQQQQRVQQTKTKRNRNKQGSNKIDAAKLANLKKDFPDLAEALGGLFFQGEARVRRHEEEEHGERPQGQEQDESILNGKGPLSLHKGD